MAGRPSERARQAAPAVCAAMAQMPVVTTCRQVVDHLAVCTQTTGWADIERGVTLLQEALRSVDRLAVADATAILSMLNGSEIKGEARRDIAGIVNSKVSLTSNIRASSRDGDRQKCQQCPTWQNYLTQRMWDQMVDPKVSWDQVLRGIVARCDELGLTNPSEKTMLRMWVTYLACRIPPESISQASPDEALRMKADIANELYIFRTRGRLPHHGQLLKYPSDPTDLQTQNQQVWRAAFSANGPVASRVDPLIVDLVVARLPCRITHTTVRAARAAAPSSTRSRRFAQSVGPQLSSALAASPHSQWGPSCHQLWGPPSGPQVAPHHAAVGQAAPPAAHDAPATPLPRAGCPMPFPSPPATLAADAGADAPGRWMGPCVGATQIVCTL